MLRLAAVLALAGSWLWACAPAVPGTDPAEPLEPELAARIAGLQERIETWRGLDFRAPVVVERKDPPQEGVAGWYEPTTDRLYLAPGSQGRFGDGVLLHELVHALQDEHFDLVAVQRAAGEDEDRQAAIGALIEGEAMLAVIELLDYDFEATVAAAPPGDDALVFPYLDGSRYVRALRDVCGTGAVDASFRSPPLGRAEIRAVTREGAAPICP